MLIGRQDALSHVDSLFHEGHALVSVVGPPGVGKSSLARAYLAGAEERDGVFVGLAACGSAMEALEAVVNALGLESGHHDEAGLTTQVARAITAREDLLLVLDNLEHLVEGFAGSLATFAAAARGARIVTTSRVRPGVAGEVVFPLGPLSLEAGDLGSEAAILFVERAFQAGALVDEPEGDDRAVVERIARRLGGIPLLLELAAASLRVMTLAELDASLEAHGVLVLPSDRTDGAERTLERAMDWSWRFLSDDVRSALAQLSLFQNGFDRQDAANITGSDAAGTLALLGMAVDHSLLQCDRPRSGEARFSMLEPVREFAMAQLGEALPDARARYVSRMVGRARALTQANRAGPLRPAIHREEPYLNDYLRAGALALEAGRGEDAFHIALGLDRLVRPRGRVRTSAPLLAAVVEPGVADGLPPEVFVEGLGAYVRLQIFAGALSGARETAARALALADTSDHPLVRGLGLAAAGVVATLTEGATREAVAKLEEAAGLVRASGDRGAVIRVLCILGHAQRMRGLHGDAQLVTEEIVRLARVNDDPWMEVIGHEALAYVALERGRSDDVRRALEALRRDRDVRLLSSKHHDGPAFAQLWASKRWRDAAHMAREGQRKAERDGVVDGHTFTTLAEAHCELRRGRADVARACADRAYEIAEGAGDSAFSGMARRFAAFFRAAAGDGEMAETLLREEGPGAGAGADALLEIAHVRSRLLRARTLCEAGRADEARTVLAECLRALDVLRGGPLSGTSAGFGTVQYLIHAAMEHVEEEYAALGGVIPASVPDEVPTEALVVGHGAHWVRPPEGVPVEVRRPVHRQLFLRLVEGRLTHPGEPVPREELAGVAWNVREASPAEIRNRLNNALSTLRKLGLKELIMHHDGGYLLDGSIPMVDLSQTGARRA